MNDMKTNLKKPCSECPFRRAHLPGWLGPYDDPRQLIVLVEWDEFPCHKTIPGKSDLSQMEACAGAAHFMANRLKMPRNKSMCDLRTKLGKSDDVFGSDDEFIEHHEQDLGEWAAKKREAAE